MVDDGIASPGVSELVRAAVVVGVDTMSVGNHDELFAAADDVDAVGSAAVILVPRVLAVVRLVHRCVVV